MVTINSTVLNFGKYTESNVFVRLLVNGKIVQQKKIDTISSYKWATVSFSWTPTAEAFKDNNAMSILVLVRTAEVVRVPQDYPMIQMAVGAANPGYTIQVASGTHYGMLSITKPMAIVGENRATTIIDGMCRIGQEEVIYLTHNINISRFTIKNGFYGILIVVDKNNIIGDNMILNTQVGIELFGSDENIVTNNTLSNNFCGIELWSSKLGTFENNSLSNNTITYNAYGLYLRWDCYSAISGNTIRCNTYGLYLDKSDSGTIVENMIRNNTYGMYLYNTYNNNIHHNSISITLINCATTMDGLIRGTPQIWLETIGVTTWVMIPMVIALATQTYHILELTIILLCGSGSQAT